MARKNCYFEKNSQQADEKDLMNASKQRKILMFFFWKILTFEFSKKTIDVLKAL